MMAETLHYWELEMGPKLVGFETGSGSFLQFSTTHPRNRVREGAHCLEKIADAKSVLTIRIQCTCIYIGGMVKISMNHCSGGEYYYIQNA